MLFMLYLNIMRIAYCLCGFLREYITSEELRSILLSSLQPASIIDIFWYAPSLLNYPIQAIELDKRSIENVFTNSNVGDVVIEWFDINMIPFYELVNACNFSASELNKYIPSPSRRFSFIHNLSRSIKLAYEYSVKNNIKYDLVVVTRPDYIKYIPTYNIPRVIEKGVYIYRVCPYRTTPEQQQVSNDNFVPDSEDRCFYGTPDFIFEMRHFYSKLVELATHPSYSSERLHTLFLWKIFGREHIYYQNNGIIINFPTKRATDFERSVKNDELEYYTSISKSI